MVVSALLCSAIAYILVSPARALGGGRFVSAWSSVFWFRVLDMEFGVEGFGLKVMGFGWGFGLVSAEFFAEHPKALFVQTRRLNNYRGSSSLGSIFQDFGLGWGFRSLRL